VFHFSVVELLLGAFEESEVFEVGSAELGFVFFQGFLREVGVAI